MIQTWNKHTDGYGSTVRVMRFDFNKTFNPMDNRTLIYRVAY